MNCFVFFQEEERMSHERDERAHLTVAALSKNGNNHSKKFNF